MTWNTAGTIGGDAAGAPAAKKNVYGVGGNSGVIMGLGVDGNSADMTWRDGAGYRVNQGW